MPEAVVRRTAIGVGEHLVRLGRLAEALARVGRRGDVRVELPRELPEGALDLRVARVAPDAEDLVVVPFCRGHQDSEGTGTRGARARGGRYSSS